MILEIVAPGFSRKTCGAVSRTRLKSADSVQDDSVVVVRVHITENSESATVVRKLEAQRKGESIICVTSAEKDSWRLKCLLLR